MFRQKPLLRYTRHQKVKASEPAAKNPTRIIAWKTKSSKKNKGDTIKLDTIPDLPAVNKKWVPVKLKVEGQQATHRRMG